MTSTVQASILEKNRAGIVYIQKLYPENKICVDCKTTVTTFVDVKIGCYLCINCAGIHRQFGTDVCRVKSLTLDNFSTEEMSMFSYTKGNKFVNKVFEGNTKYLFKRPTYEDGIKRMEDFIRRKYKNREFYIDEKSVESTIDLNLKKETKKGQVKKDPILLPPPSVQNNKTNNAVKDLITFDDLTSSQVNDNNQIDLIISTHQEVKQPNNTEIKEFIEKQQFQQKVDNIMNLYNVSYY